MAADIAHAAYYHRAYSQARSTSSVEQQRRRRGQPATAPPPAAAALAEAPSPPPAAAAVVAAPEAPAAAVTAAAAYSLPRLDSRWHYACLGPCCGARALAHSEAAATASAQQVAHADLHEDGGVRCVLDPLVRCLVPAPFLVATWVAAAGCLVLAFQPLWFLLAEPAWRITGYTVLGGPLGLLLVHAITLLSTVASTGLSLHAFAPQSKPSRSWQQPCMLADAYTCSLLVGGVAGFLFGASMIGYHMVTLSTVRVSMHMRCPPTPARPLAPFAESRAACPTTTRHNDARISSACSTGACRCFRWSLFHDLLFQLGR